MFSSDELIADVLRQPDAAAPVGTGKGLRAVTPPAVEPALIQLPFCLGPVERPGLGSKGVIG